VTGTVTATAAVAALPRQRGDATSGGRGRDQYVDALRALALVRVVTYHTFGWIWLPVLFPSMGVMFALAGSLVAASLARSPGGHWHVLRTRVRRLLPPLWLYGAVVVALMLHEGWTVTRTDGDPLDVTGALAWLVPLQQPAGSAWGQDLVVPLWYIRTYLWLLLLSPVLYWLFRRYPRGVFAAPAALLVLLELGVLPSTTATGDTLAHLATFATCWLVGFAHRDGSLGRLPGARTVLGGVALMALGIGWALTHQRPGTGWNVDEIPVADALYATGAVLVLLRLYPRGAVLARTPRLARLVGAMNARAMTIYLWGNLAIAAATPVVESNPITLPLSDATWQGDLAQYVAAWLVLVAVVLAVGWVEDVAAGRRPRVDPFPPRAGAAAVPAWRVRRPTAVLAVLATVLGGALAVGVLGPAGRARAAHETADEALPGVTAGRGYPLHRGVPATVFRIGALVPGRGADGQSLQSGWDRDWALHYGGCDGHGVPGVACRSDLAERTGPDWFPVDAVPQENPYYVGLPYNDLLDAADRAAVPWAGDPGYAEHRGDRTFSLLKNRWVRVTGPAGSCDAQVEDTGPGPQDAPYVLGSAAPAHDPAINLGPALAACVGLRDTGAGARVDWSFVAVPRPGPWTAVVTTRQAGRQGDQSGRQP
jgi:peptidoglycan/LPS O-acetylase OafA/YrhL